MITNRISLSHFGKLLLNLELTKVQTGQIINRFLGETSYLVNILRLNFSYVFIDLSHVQVPFLKK